MSLAVDNTGFLPSELVQIRLPAQSGGESETTFDGRVAAAGYRTLRISLSNVGQSCVEMFSHSARCVISKHTPRGMLEFDALGETHDSAAGESMLTVTILGPLRQIQRRDYFRFMIGTQARYCILEKSGEAKELGNGPWHAAELHDVSLGGASLLLPHRELRAGLHLVIEFSLNGQMFSFPAVVRRIQPRHAGALYLYGVEYLDLDRRQQDRMSKAIAKLQQKIIRSRIKVD